MMTRLTSAMALAALLGLSLAGCKDDPPAPASSGTTAASAAAVGLNASSNEPTVVQLAQAAIAACNFNQAGGYFVPSCAEVKAFNASSALESEAGQRTLVAMLEDPDVKVRGLAARGLTAKGRLYRADHTLAMRVIDALTSEKHKGVALQMSDAVARISGERSKTLEALKKVASSHPKLEVRVRLIGPLLGNNRSQLHDFVATRARDDAEEQVRMAAVSAFWANSPKDRSAEACDFWLERFAKDQSSKVAARCAYYIGHKKVGGVCSKQYDALLDGLEARAKQGKVDDGNYSSALQSLHDAPHASKEQQARAAAVAKLVLDNEANAGVARAEALRMLAAATSSKAAAKALANKYLKAASAHVRNAAQRIIDG